MIPPLALGLVIVLLGACCWADLRRLVIPKWLSISIALIGFALQMFQGACGKLGTEVGLAGAGWGFVAALGGFLVGFGVAFLLWLPGVCGGGDVKLIAALGAVLGVLGLFIVLVVSVPLVLLVALGTLGVRLAKGRPKPAGRSRIGLALPLTLAVLLVLVGQMYLVWNSSETGTEASTEQVR